MSLGFIQFIKSKNAIIICLGFSLLWLPIKLWAAATVVNAPSAVPVTLVSGDSLLVTGNGSITPLLQPAVSITETVAGGNITVQIDAPLVVGGGTINVAGGNVNATLQANVGAAGANHQTTISNAGFIINTGAGAVVANLLDIGGRLIINNTGTIGNGGNDFLFPTTATNVTTLNINAGSTINARLLKTAAGGTSTINVNANFTSTRLISGHNNFNVRAGTFNDQGIVTLSAANGTYSVSSGATVNMFAAAQPTTGVSFFNSGTYRLPTTGGAALAFDFTSASNNGTFDSNFTTQGKIVRANSFVNNGQILHGLHLQAHGGAGSFTLTNTPNGVISGNVLINTSIGGIPGFFIINGGAVNGQILGTPGFADSTLRVNGNFSTNGNINGITHVQINGGTFNLNNLVLNGSTFTVNPGAVAIVNPTGGIFSTTLTNNSFMLLNGGQIGSTSFINNGTLTINSGNITSPITSTTSSSVINVNGNFSTQNTISHIGTINVNGGTFSVNNPISFINTLNVNGGIMAVNNFVTSIGAINVVGGNLLLNPTGVISNYGSLINNSVITMNGGTIFGSIVGSGNPGSTINVTGPFTTQGSIVNVGLINVNASTMTVNHPVTGFTQFTINSGATALVNSSGTLVPLSGALVVINSNGTLYMNGGSVAGPIVGSGNSFLFINNDFTTQGTITGVGNITVANGTFNVNNAISGFSNFIMASTVNLNGPGVFGNIEGLGSNSVLNINGNYVTGQNIGAIGTSTPIGTTNINSGASLTLNNNIGSTFLNNNGQLVLTTVQNLTGNYFQGSGGHFVTFLQNPNLGSYGRLNISGTATIGGFIDVSVANEGLGINNGDFFDLLVSGNTMTLNNPVLNAPQTAVLSFVQDTSAPANTYRIRAVRTAFADVTDTTTVQGIAAALDQIRLLGIGGELGEIVRGLNRLSSVNDVIRDLEQLLPVEVTGGPIMGGLVAQNIVLNKITERINSFRLGVDNLSGYIAGDGYSAGDFVGYHGDAGPFVFGNTLNQSRRNGVNGYYALTGGVGIMGDAPISCNARIGAALSYASTNVRDRNSIGNRTQIGGFHGTVYGSVDYDWLFADGMASAGQNQYNVQHFLPIINRTAQAKYNGTQTVLKTRVGVVLPFGDLEISPLATLQYAHLNRKQYTETNAGNAAQTVLGSRNIGYTVAGGVRFMEVSEPSAFLPEIHVLAIRDLKSITFTTTSQFIGGGPLFISPGPPFPKSGVNVGGSISVRFSELWLTGNYDYERRQKFFSHTLWLRALYIF